MKKSPASLNTKRKPGLKKAKLSVEEALHVSENRYRRLFESAKDGILILDFETCKIIDANPYIIDLIDLPLKEILGRELWEAVHFSNKDQMEQACSELKTHGYAHFDDIPIRKRSGEITEVEFVSNVYSEGNLKVIQCNIRDITERIYAKEALHESEAKTKTILEAISTGIIIVDPETHTIVDVNKEAAKLFGESKEKIIGNHCHKFICPAENGKCPVTDLKQLVDNSERILINKDGKRIPILKTVAQINLGGKKLLVENFTDISARKQTEIALSESEAKFRTIVTQSPDGIFTTDLTGNFLSVNKAMCDLLKYSEEEFLSLNIWDLVPKKYFHTHEAELTALIKGESSSDTYGSVEYEVKGKDGSMYFVEVLSSPYYEGENIIGIQNYARDITERKNFLEVLKSNEQKFMVLAEQSPNLIFINYQGRIVYVNQKCIDLMGYSKEEYYAEDFDFMILIDNDYKDIIGQNFHKSMNGIEVEPLDYRIVTKNNTKLDAIIFTQLIDYNGGKAIMGIITDITERKQAEKNLLVEKERYEAITNAIPDLVFRLDRKGVYKDFKAEDSELSIQSENIIGQRNRDLMPPEFADLVDFYIQTALDTGETQTFEYQLPVPGQGMRDYSARMVISGKDEVIVFVRDISDSKQAEKDLQESEARLSLVFNNTSDMQTLMKVEQDNKLRIVAVNRSYLESIKQFISRDDLDINDIVGKYRDEALIALGFSAENLNAELQYFLRVIASGTPIQYEQVIPYGTTNVYLESTIVPVTDAAGRCTHLLYSVRNITERKQAEKEIQKSEFRYRDLFENSGTAIWEADLSSVINYLNELKEKGIHDFRLYFDEHAEELVKCALMVKITDANKEILKFAKATSIKEIQDNMSALFTEGSFEGLKEEFIGLAEGKLRVDVEMPLRTLNGEIKQVLSQLSIVPGYEKTWGKGLISFIDLTDRKEAERILKESEEHLHQILENVDAVFYMISNKTGELVYVNSAYEKVWGRSIETVKEDMNTWLDAVHVEDKGIAIELFEKFSGEAQYRIVLPDGTIRWIWDRMFPVMDEKGEIIYLCGMASDITNRRQSEEALHESQANLDQAVKISKLGTWEYNVDQNLFTFNDQFYSLLRTTAEQEGGYTMTPMQYAQKFVHPDDASMVGEETKKALETTDPNYDTQLDHRIIYADGEPGYFTVNIRIEKDLNGRTVKSFGVNQDITERKQAEASLKLFRTLIDKSNDAIEVIDMETGQYLDVNEKACSDLGYSRDELLSMKVFDVDPDQSAETFTSMMSEFRQSNSNIIESIHRRKDGSTFPVEINVTLVKLEKMYTIAIVRDITERKLAEKELAASEERYKLLFESAAEGILLVDVETMEYKLANKAICNMFGYTEQEMLKLSIKDMHPKAKLDFVISEFKSQAQGKRAHSTNIPCLRKDGTLFYANIYNAIIYIDNRKHNIGFFNDITAQKEATGKLELFRALIDHSNDFIQLIDLQTGQFVDCNERSYREFGYTREEFLSLKPADVDKTLTEENSLELIEAVKKKGSMLAEGVALRKDGSTFPIEVNLNYVKLEQEFIVVIGRDITERKKLEKNLSTAAEMAKLGYWEFDVKSGNFIFDDQYYRLIHGSSTEKQGGNTMSAEEFVRRFVHPDDSHMVAKSLQEAISSPDPEYFGQAETRVFRDNGDITNVMVQFKVLKDQFGNTQTVYGVNQDITELKRTEKELISAKNKAEESDRLKSAFLANMSHEIRTPMNGILGFTELLKEPLLSGEEQTKYIEIIEKSGLRMLNIINDIISISRIEAGQAEISITDTNVIEQLEYIYIFFKKEAEQKKLDFSFKNSLSKDEAVIKSDREKIYAVLTNLVKNAVKFTSSGSIEFGCEKKGEFLEFFVKDTGRGIRDEQKELIFERFRQGSEALNRDYEGSGLGLAISKGYVEMLGGKIWTYPNMHLDPDTGITQEKGSIFYFTIPVYPSEKTKTVSSIAPTEDLTKNKSKKLKILVVEDDEVSQLFLNRIIKNISEKLLNVPNGAEAVESCKNNPDIDLILMDMKMPVMDGFEATRKIREFNKDVIIIAQTAYGLSGDKDKALEGGCNDYISKPIDKSKLEELINKYFE